MSAWAVPLNDYAVSLFGSILAAYFCDAMETQKNRQIFWACMLVIPLLQAAVYATWNEAFLRQIYPLVIHLPLLCLLTFLTKKLLWPFISILTAYLCCQLRRWVGLLVVALLPERMVMLEVVELIVTIPILLLLLKFSAPGLRRLASFPAGTQCRFGGIPLLYYIFDYVTSVYTDLLSSGSPVVVEFMPFVCCAAYLIFLLYDSTEAQKRAQMEQTQKSMGIQLTQAVREIDALRQSQTLAACYRHDLRHHLQYLSACLENGQTQEAQTYISTICQEIEGQKVRQYCENETANLILSAFVGRAEKEGVSMEIEGAIPAFIALSNNDLCVLLSNALENALHACQPMADEGLPCTIQVRFYVRSDKLFLQVTNPYRGEIRMEKGVPVSDRPGHGIGVQSICAIVERYRGIYSFSAQNGQFVLRLSV